MLKFGKCGLSLLISVGKRRKDPVTSCGSFDRKINISRVCRRMERSILLEFCCRVANKFMTRL